jgi:hypothetical protein
MTAMVVILDDSLEIEAARRLLTDRFASSPSRTVFVTIPYRPKDLAVEVHWFPDHKFWIVFDIDDRMMLGLVEKDPEESQRVALTLEFAIPYEGIDRFTQGALAADECGNLLLVCRGGFGIGNRGVGRKAFLKKYGGTILTVTDGDRQTDVALVAVLGSIHFLDQFSSFLREVDSMRTESF